MLTKTKKQTILFIEITKEDNKLLKRNKLGNPKRLEDYDLGKIDNAVFYIVVKTQKGEETFNFVKIKRDSPDSRHLLIEDGTNKNGKPRYRSFEMKTRVPILFSK